MAKKIFTNEAENKIFVASLILMGLTFIYNFIISILSDNFASLISLSIILSTFFFFILSVGCLNLALLITKKYKFASEFTILGILFYIIITSIIYYFIINYSIMNIISLAVFSILFMVLSIFIGGLVKD